MKSTITTQSTLPRVLLLVASILAVAPLAQAEEDLDTLKKFGWLMSQNLTGLELTDAENAAFQEGFNAGLNGEADYVADEQAANMAVQEFVRSRYLSVQDSSNADFFAELEAQDGVQKTASGLYYEIIEPGNEVRATEADQVQLHYVGTLTDGTVFDSSRARGTPATFPVAGVVPGFSEGVQLLGEGGKAKLYIKPDMAYGDTPRGNIPPRSILVFDIEMIDVIQPEAPEVPEAAEESAE